ncbi:MAG TPA: hypothetical protein VG518_07240 [Solirubrobacterales bacterium]|nr:hypothetical protein [Solirubrobacterales bacterium]
MAIGLRIKLDGVTAETYEAVNATMNVDNDPPEGLIFHSGGPIDGGWGVLDFWESREHFDRFQESRLGPAIMGLGDEGPSGPPDIKEFPVLHYVKP